MTDNEKEAISKFVYEEMKSGAVWEDLKDVMTKCCEWGISYARKWHRYPEEKPQGEETVLIYSQFNHDCSVGWLNKKIEGPECWINESGEIPEVSHWQPIHLPESER